MNNEKNEETMISEQEHLKMLQTRDARIEELTRKYSSKMIESELQTRKVKSAPLVADFLALKVRLDEKGDPVILDDAGHPRQKYETVTDGEGKIHFQTTPMGIPALVDEFLADPQNAHLKADDDDVKSKSSISESAYESAFAEAQRKGPTPEFLKLWQERFHTKGKV